MLTGIRQERYMTRIILSMETLKRNWSSMVAHERVHFMLVSIFAALTSEGVPLPKFQLINCTDPLAAASFNISDWLIKVNVKLAIGRLSDPDEDLIKRVAILGGGLAHEARHCEQCWRMVRLMLERVSVQGLTPAVGPLQHKLPYMNEVILRKAINEATWHTRLTLKEKWEAESWYESAFGKGSAFSRSNAHAPHLSRVSGGFADVGRMFGHSAYARYQRGIAVEEDAWTFEIELKRRFLLGKNVEIPGDFLRPRVLGGVSSF